MFNFSQIEVVTIQIIVRVTDFFQQSNEHFFHRVKFSEFIYFKTGRLNGLDS